MMMIQPPNNNNEIELRPLMVSYSNGGARSSASSSVDEDDQDDDDSHSSDDNGGAPKGPIILLKSKNIHPCQFSRSCRRRRVVVVVGCKSVVVVLLLLIIIGSLLLTTTSLLAKQQQRQRPTFTTCNCYTHTSNNNKMCCQRVIFRTHKFGTILLGDLFASFRHQESSDGEYEYSIQTQPTPKSSNYTLPNYYNNKEIDYRHLLVTRNWFDAVVSGYLYHRAGYECWLEYNGGGGGGQQQQQQINNSSNNNNNNNNNNMHHSKYFDMEAHYHNKYWDTQHLQYHHWYNISYPPRNNRSLCLYLAQESEEAGIKVIMDVALSRWYKGVVAYHKLAVDQQAKAAAAAAAARHNDDDEIIQRSLFLCYEDLVDPFQQEGLFYQILEFMFPGRKNNLTDLHMPMKMKQMLLQQQQNHSHYTGGHASTNDPALRARLRNMVVQYDRELFHDIFATSNSIFGCGLHGENENH